MKQVYNGPPYGVMVCLLSTVLIVNGISAYFGYSIFSSVTKVISVIAILTLYYSKSYRMATVFLTIFMFLFLSDVFSVFNFGQLTSRLSITFNLGAYSLLLFVILGKFKRMKYEGLVSVYLILVLLINSYFLYMLYGALKDNFTDTINLVLYIGHGITLIGLTFFAFAVYLSQESTQSIIFLIMVFSFVFSDVLNYICNLYVYFWVFDFISDILHLTSLCLFFVYVNNHHKIIKLKPKDIQENYILKSSDRLTA